MGSDPETPSLPKAQSLGAGEYEELYSDKRSSLVQKRGSLSRLNEYEDGNRIWIYSKYLTNLNDFTESIASQINQSRIASFVMKIRA